MRIALIADQKKSDAFQLTDSAELVHFNTWEEADNLQNVDACIYWNDDVSTLDFHGVSIPLFVSSVTNTLEEMGCGQNVVRFNGWEGFFQKPLWEICGELSPQHMNVLQVLGKKAVQVPDIVGMVSCRVIAMIINEAFFALEAGVSTEKEIDTAMRLGTNYPYGPFEWADLIGREHWYELLLKLSHTDKRYTPCKLLN